MGIFEKFAQVEQRTIEVTLLGELGQEPAFVVTARVISGREVTEALDRYKDRTGTLDLPKWRSWRGRRVVPDWRGLTVNNLRRLIPGVKIDLQKVQQMFGDGPLPYSADLAADLHLQAIIAFGQVIDSRCDEERTRLKEQIDDEIRGAQGNSHVG